MAIYHNIIKFEKDVLNTQIPFYIFNNLYMYER